MDEPRDRIPLLTFALIAANVFVFVALAGEPSIDEAVLARYWIYPNPEKIWNGAYWTLLTAPFVHLQFLHLLFNLAWLWGLGSRIERALGRQTLFALVFFGAIFSSGAQIAWDAPGLGASGVVYALFGFMLGARRQVALFHQYLSRAVVRLLVAWLALGALIAAAGVWPIGNAAHVAGVVFGLAAARLFVVRRQRPAAAALLAGLAALTLAALCWLPWSLAWRQWRLMEAAHAGRLAELARDLEPLARSDRPLALNNAAWLLATARDARIRDGRRAVELARRAVSRNGWREAVFIDTLAAAYAELGDWSKAAAYERLALKLLDEQKRGAQKRQDAGGAQGGQPKRAPLAETIAAQLEDPLRDPADYEQMAATLRKNQQAILARQPLRE